MTEEEKEYLRSLEAELALYKAQERVENRNAKQVRSVGDKPTDTGITKSDKKAKDS